MTRSEPLPLPHLSLGTSESKSQVRDKDTIRLFVPRKVLGSLGVRIRGSVVVGDLGVSYLSCHFRVPIFTSAASSKRRLGDTEIWSRLLGLWNGPLYTMRPRPSSPLLTLFGLPWVG